jgi:hypothetical protein
MSSQAFSDPSVRPSSPSGHLTDLEEEALSNLLLFLQDVRLGRFPMSELAELLREIQEHGLESKKLYQLAVQIDQQDNPDQTYPPYPLAP